MVVHEATFTNDMRERALIAGHSTAGMAGNFAKYVDAGSLILTHFSARFEDTDSQWEELRRTNAKGKLKDLMQVNKAPFSTLPPFTLFFHSVYDVKRPGEAQEKTPIDGKKKEKENELLIWKFPLRLLFCRRRVVSSSCSGPRSASKHL